MERGRQLTIREMVEELKKVKDQESEVFIDFAWFRPVDVGSWRGSYNELAIRYETLSDKAMTVKKLVEVLEGAIGKSYPGWKGGEFEMHGDTPVWVDNAGDGSMTGVVGIKDLGYRILIETSYIECR